MIDQPAHSDCGPSSLERRILCPGSRNAERGLPETASGYAAEGTVFHEVAAMCLEFGLEPDDFLDKEFEADGYTFTFDESFAHHMRPGIDRVREMLADCEHSGHETRVDISPWTEPGQFGTTDNWGVSVEKRTIKVHDWKYGEGVGVEAEGNVQAVAYALGIWNDVGWLLLGDQEDVKVEIVVDQMRRPEGGGRWKTTLAECLRIGEEIREAVARTADPQAPRVAGLKQCFFCKAKGRCSELAAFNLAQAAMKFDDLMKEDLPPPNIRDMTPEEISSVVRNAPLWSVWIKAVHETALGMVMQGHTIPNLKAVPGRRGHRIWMNETVAERSLKQRLGEQAYARKLVSPAQAEKLLGSDDILEFEVLWTQRESKPSLVIDTDPREALESHPAKFDNLDGD